MFGIKESVFAHLLLFLSCAPSTDTHPDLSDAIAEGVDEVFEAATRAAILVRDSEAARRRPPKHENYNEKGNNRRRSTVGMLEGSMHRKSEGDHSNSCCLIL